MRSLHIASLIAFVSALFSGLVGYASAAEDANELPASSSVLFVCEHGSVKSLIGASLFDQVAKKRGLPFRAVSRGVSPDARVPPSIVAALRNDGVQVETFKPQRVSALDMNSALRVIAIGVEGSSLPDGKHTSIEQWNDVPAASVDYAAARASLLRHIETLVDELASRR
jgi:arsenate reductase (thioredoxin)